MDFADFRSSTKITPQNVVVLYNFDLSDVF